MKLNDEQRLEALGRSGLLTKSSNEGLTHVCYSAVELIKADAAQINVLDARFQYTIAEWPRVPPRPKIDIAQSGCQQVIVDDDVVAINDTVMHPTMCVLPWTVTWRAYLGAPLRYRGQVIGSICVLGVNPREWSTHDRLAAQSLAILAESCVEPA